MSRRLSEAELLEKLKANPDLRERIECLLLAVEDESGELREADAAELRIIDEMRQLGRESLTAWAQRQVVKTAEEIRSTKGVWREGKKNCGGTARLAK
jgi:hypothetical protein